MGQESVNHTRDILYNGPTRATIMQHVSMFFGLKESASARLRVLGMQRQLGF